MMGVFLVGIYFLLTLPQRTANRAAMNRKLFGIESFTEWPGAGVRATPPLYAVAKESFVSKSCPDGTRSDGPCLLEFPSF